MQTAIPQRAFSAHVPAIRRPDWLARTVFSFAGCAALCLSFFAADARAAGFDLGDAPAPYPTLRANNGAQHAVGVIAGFQLGARLDQEPDGQPDANALGDDLSITPGFPLGSDEDGVSFGTLAAGQIATVLVVASQPGLLDAWIDFNADGDWDGPADSIFASTPMIAGVNTLTFTVPLNAHLGFTFARFRLSKNGGLSFLGPAPDGEVEDYRVRIDQPQVAVDLMITKSVSPNPIAVGGNLTYTLLVKYKDTVPVSVSNVTVTDMLPPNVTFISANSSQGTCSLLGGTVTCTLGTLLGASSQASITIIIAPTTAIRLTNTACVFSSNPDPTPENNCATIVTEVTAAPVTPPCDLTNSGRDFWLTFPANYAPDPTNHAQLSLHLTGQANVTGLVTIPGLGFSTNWTISSGLIATVNLPWEADLGELNNLVTNKGIHITATGEISVYALNHASFTSDAYLGLPNTVLGTEYMVLAYRNVHSEVPEISGTQFAIVAPENNTIITITPRITTGERLVGVPFTVAMNRGDTYQLRNTNNAPNDLSGTFITANKPIGVFGGHRCANIQGITDFFCDTVVEQLLPLTAWGNYFLAVPLATRLNGDTYRFVASQMNTAIKTNGMPLTMLNRGDVYEQLVAGPVEISSDKPILVAQYANSSNYDSVTNADPFMVLVPPMELFRADYLVYSMTNGFTTNFLNLVVHSSLINQILLDGIPVPSSNLSSMPISGSGYFGAQLPVGPGKHTVSQSPGGHQPFGVTVYGFGTYDSYGYPGGMRFGDVQSPVINCPDGVVLTISPTNCLATVPSFLATVHDNCTPESALQVTQLPAVGTMLAPGTYDLVLTSTDFAGNKGTCTSQLKVLDRDRPTIQCPSNIVVRTLSSSGQIVNFQVTGGTPCSPQMNVICSPPSGTLFPIGVRTVTCSIPNPNATLGTAPIQCTFTVTVLPLRIDITLTKQALLFQWTGADTLESASSVAGPWKEVLNARSPYTVALGGSGLPKGQFYRLRCVACQ